MALICSDCGKAVTWAASGCVGCGVLFHEIRCIACGFLGTADRFEQQRCPRCSKDKFVIVPSEDEAIEEVGSDAFLDDAPLVDEIERSFSRTRDENREEPPPTSRRSKSETAPKSKSTEDAANEHATYELNEDGQPQPKPKNEPGRGDDPSRNKRPRKPKAAERDDRPGESVEDREKRLSRQVLKRQTWVQTPDSEDPAKKEQPPPAKKDPVRTTKQQPVTSRRATAIRFEMSPKVQQILRWSALGLPLLIVLLLVIYWIGGSGRGSRTRHPSDTIPGVGDSGVFEAQAARLYESAKEYYQSGQKEQATSTLNQIVSQYPMTSVSVQAREALDRLSRGQPPFTELASLTAEQPPPTQAAAEPPTGKKKPFIGIPAEQPSAPPAPDAPEQNLAAKTTSAGPQPPNQGSTLVKANVKARALPSGFVAVPEAGVHSSGWPIEIICLKDKSHMMLAPAGEFEMGNSSGEPNTRPQHRVILKAFYIDKFEITLNQYKTFLDQRLTEKNPYRDLPPAALAAAATDRHPVVGVAWRDANAFAEWSGKSLPTEAQWEKAARGTDARRHPWGNESPQWDKPREPTQLNRVGSFPWDVSIFGCYDMAGNAWEWCADWYDQNYYPSSPTEEPQGPKSSLPPVQYGDPERVIRGGSSTWQITWRAPCGLQEEPLYAGFRCVLEVEKLPARPATTAAAAPTAPRPTAAPVKVPPGGFKF